MVLISSSTLVYPRVGGGTLHHAGSWLLAGTGLSPRGRGNVPLLHGRLLCQVTCRGLSPRGRGNPSDAWSLMAHTYRSIPAWAGETVLRRVVAGDLGDGLSPRGRGILHSQIVPATTGYPCPGSIPAWAGEPTGGVGLVRNLHWSIPAWAGEPVHAGSGYLLEPVYPRVGGGTVRLLCDRWHSPRVGNSDTGLSPRGRGNPPSSDWRCRKRLLAAPYRSIPAWAGEPLRPVD